MNIKPYARVFIKLNDAASEAGLSNANKGHSAGTLSTHFNTNAAKSTTGIDT